MKLKEILKDINVVSFKGNMDIEILDVESDSRKVKNGAMFVCIDGFEFDGHKFANNAIENGANCIVATKDLELPDEISYVKVDDSRVALAQIANIFMNYPSKKFKLVGVTGTKGKTTTTFMIKSILEKAKQKVGLVGTVANYIGNEKIETSRTTPESLELQKLFKKMENENVDSAIMEVSSQGLALHRVDGSYFDIGVFTNLSRDHIGNNEHKDMDDYFNAKLKLFKMCKRGLVNKDSEYANKVIKNSDCDITTYGINLESDIKAKDVKTYSDSVEFIVKTPWGETDIHLNVPGIFSVYNALAAIGVCGLLGIDLEIIKEGLKNVSVPGRAEIVDVDTDFTVMIDYAHSPDSLENILKAVNQFAKGRVVTLFGCGGDRDKTKRPIMGRIAGELSDYCVVTSDNPRTENPIKILDDIIPGVKETDCEYSVIENRRDAIEYALKNAKKDDIIILAGKGHETYQILNDKTIHFDEKVIVHEILKKLS